MFWAFQIRSQKWILPCRFWERDLQSWVISKIRPFSHWPGKVFERKIFLSWQKIVSFVTRSYFGQWPNFATTVLHIGMRYKTFETRDGKPRSWAVHFRWVFGKLCIFDKFSAFILNMSFWKSGTNGWKSYAIKNEFGIKYFTEVNSSWSELFISGLKSDIRHANLESRVTVMGGRHRLMKLHYYAIKVKCCVCMYVCAYAWHCNDIKHK